MLDAATVSSTAIVLARWILSRSGDRYRSGSCFVATVFDALQCTCLVEIQQHCCCRWRFDVGLWHPRGVLCVVFGFLHSAMPYYSVFKLANNIFAHVTPRMCTLPLRMVATHMFCGILCVVVANDSDVLLVLFIHFPARASTRPLICWHIFILVFVAVFPWVTISTSFGAISLIKQFLGLFWVLTSFAATPLASHLHLRSHANLRSV